MILIKNAQIVDGSGRQPYRADLLIDGKKISAIGTFSNKKAEEVFDGLGLMATPGFIDVNTDSDHYLSLFTNPAQQDFLLQGVTTIIGGQCGSSLAPLIYGSLVSIRKWANPYQINVGWNRMEEFLDILRKLRLGVNFATLAGHSTIRRDLIGEEIRNLSKSEMAVFSRVLEQALKEGALGLSTGLGYIHAKAAPYGEIKELVHLAAKHNKVYATHLRDEKSDLIRSVEETIKVAQETGARTIISHLRPIRGFEKEFETAINLVEKNLAKAHIYFDVNPFDESLVPIYSLLPDWAKNGGLEVMLGYLNDEKTRREIIKEMAHIKPDEYIIAEAQNQERVIGKTLEQLAKNREKSAIDALLELMEGTGLRAMLAHRNLDPNLLGNLLVHPRSLIGSNGASLPEKGRGLKLERTTSTFPKFLEAAASRNVPIEQAVKKITSIAAQVYGIKNRGLIKGGYWADITLLKDNKATDVLINGKFAVRNSQTTGELAGNVI